MNGTYESTPDEAYLDRNLAVQVLARMAKELHYRVGIRDEDTEWPVIYIELPTGQVSWHIPAKELVGDFMETVLQWDGHDVEIKRQRLVDYVQEKHKLVTHLPRKCDYMTAISAYGPDGDFDQFLCASIESSFYFSFVVLLLCHFRATSFHSLS